MSITFEPIVAVFFLRILNRDENTIFRMRKTKIKKGPYNLDPF